MSGNKVVIAGVVGGLIYVLAKAGTFAGAAITDPTEGSDFPEGSESPIPPLNLLNPPDNFTYDEYYRTIPVTPETAALGIYGGDAYAGLVGVLTYIENPIAVAGAEQFYRQYGGALDGHYLLPSSYKTVTDWYISNGGKNLISHRETVFTVGANRAFHYFTADNNSIEMLLAAVDALHLTAIYREIAGVKYILADTTNADLFDLAKGIS